MPSESRLTIRTLAPHTAATTLADDVRDGLGASPKTLPPKYFYDELGSKLFEAICLLPEYYPTRAEREIFASHADEIVSRMPNPVELVEMGSGTAEKTRLLIEALLRRQETLRYLPVDISAGTLEESARDLLNAYTGLRVAAYAGDYAGAIEELRDEPREGMRLTLFLGSNIGNFACDEAGEFLRGIRSTLQCGDALLLGADLKKDPAVLEAAYDDPTGVTAAFNLNVLARINRELGASFDLRKFAHLARYDAECGRVEMHLVSQRAQSIEIRALDMTVEFREGESIHTENSHKYDLDDLSQMARDAKFERVETWFDSERRFSSNLFIAAG